MNFSMLRAFVVFVRQCLVPDILAVFIGIRIGGIGIIFTHRGTPALAGV